MNVIRTSPSRWRNLGIVAHVDAGKTTLTERLLWKTGAIHRVGEVHHGNATTDFSDIEKRRGITIGAAAVQAHWTRGEPHRLTLIDTPGHVDFAIEVERSLRVLDGAVVVFSAVDGVQPQTESVWRQAVRHGVPALAFVNKMDRVGADFARVVDEIRERLDATPLPVGEPVGAEDAFAGWIDFVTRERVAWTDDGETRAAWTEAETARHEPARQALVEAVADLDDALAQAFLEGVAIDADALRAALRRCTLARTGVPVLAGAAFKNKGIECLLDAVVDYLPSPLDRPAVRAENQDGAEIALASDAAGPLAALVFKTAHQGQAPMAFVRVYSGAIAVGDSVWCSRRGQLRRIARLAVVQADRVEEVGAAQAGEIVSVLGWKDAVSGETLAHADQRLVLETIVAQPAVLAVRLTPETAADQLRMAQGLASLAQDDPSFRVETDPDTGEMLAWGMGELHLEVKIEQLRTDWRVGVRVGTPRVAYLETPLAAVAGVEGKVSKQTGGPGQFARVVIDVAPRSDHDVTFRDATRGGVVPKGFVHATEKGVRAALGEGPQGFPVVGVDLVLVDGECHAQDSSELAFQRAGTDAMRAALARVGTQRLEPVMRLVIESPPANVGDIVGDLQKRQGRVLAIEDRGGRAEVVALAPLAALAGYATSLRSLSQGRALASQVLAGHEPVRNN